MQTNQIKNETTQTEDIVTDENIQPRVEPMGEVGTQEQGDAKTLDKEGVSPTTNTGTTESKVEVRDSTPQELISFLR